MKKNLFLTCALALFAIVGVSAQEWCRTLATGLPGTEITHDVNGTSVTQYRAQTALIQNAGAKGVRYTVVQTTATGTYGGGPFFAMGEMIVLNADGDTVQYTVTSNADHNSGGAGTDGAGLPALNDGNFNNFFHSSWGGTEPGGLHYLELTFAEPLDAYQLIWYTRPNQHVNRPQVVGLTNPGVEFTEDMLFAEYGFELGEQVTTAAEIAAGGTFAFYVEAPADLSDYGDYTSNGNTFVALSGYTTGSNAEAGPQNIVQLIPGDNGKFVIYQPVLGSYYGNPDRWTDGYNGKNGWLRAYSEGWTLGEFNITPKGNTGEFEITTEITRQYVDGNWVNYENPLKVWVGYDPRGNLKIFPEAVKVGLENGDFTQGFGLPVDFGFQINKANVNQEMVPNKTVSSMCAEVLEKIIATAKEKAEQYAEYMEDYDWDGAVDALEDALEAAEDAVEEANLAAAFEAKTELEKAIALMVAQLANYYEELHGNLTEEFESNKAVPPYTQADAGKYTPASGEILAQIKALFDEVLNNSSLSYSQIESKWAQIETLIEQFYASTLKFSTFPEVVEGISNSNFPEAYPNNAVWKQNVVLAAPIKGVRITPLSVYIGSAGGGGLYGGYPMLALGEIKLYDADGNEVALDESMVSASHTEQNEGFESTAARLVDGVITGAGSYYHSPWSGTAPSEYVYIDLTFPAEMDNFTLEVYSRDKSTTGGQVSLFPHKVALTTVGESYDPVLFAENPYNVFVGEQVTDVAQIEDGIYVIKGLLNTSETWNADENGNPTGVSKFIAGTERFHNAAAAVRAQSVFRFTKNSDGTYKVLNLGLAKYIPSTTENGYITPTYSEAEAANMTIVKAESEEFPNTFVMYEYNEGLTTDGDSIDTDGDEAYDAVDAVYQTPYVVYMDWAPRMAARPVINPQPRGGVANDIADAKGDSLCFNKGNGEGQWEIYKVTMDNPDFYWLTNMVGAFDDLGLIVGTDPGCVSDLGALEAVLAAGQKVVADSAYADAPAAAAALAKEIAAVDNLEKNPMVPGVYQVVSASADFKAKQGVEKALYATVTEDGTPTFGWKTLQNGSEEFYFDFAKSDVDAVADLVASGKITKEQKDLVYTIRAISTYDGSTPYYIGESDSKSTQIDLFGDAWSDYLVVNAVGSSFNLQLATADNGFSIHANQHGGGAGQSSNIVYWDGSAGASQWFLRKVDYETSIEDLIVEGQDAVSVAYYTVGGTAIPAPVKGVNIVVTTYANGVVETKKVLVK